MRLLAHFHHSNLRALRIVSWSSAIVLVLLSLLPSSLEIRTGAPDELEHFIAYFAAALLFGISYPQKRFLVAGTLLLIAAFLEALQVFSPGRSVRLRDVVFSGAGAILGCVAASFVARCSVHLSRRRR